MALFEINSNHQLIEPLEAATNNFICENIICKSPNKINELMQVLNKKCNVWYLSKGDFSVHDVVLSILNKFGKSNLYFSTYSIRELPIRKLILAKDANKIGSINMLVDYRAQKRTPEAFQLASMNSTLIGLYNVHAKVCVVEHEKGYCTITGSQNWTTNPKVESGVISNDEAIGIFNKNWILNLLENAEILDNIADLAGLFYTKKQICIILELDYFEFQKEMANENSSVYKHYYKGKLQSDVNHRRTIFKLANSGSSPAQSMVQDLIKRNIINE